MFQSVGINLSGNHASGEDSLAEAMENLKGAGDPDFVELCPHNLGVILEGKLDPAWLDAVERVLGAANLGYTVHAPHRMNLMDLSSLEVHRDALESSVRFAGRIGAGVVVCHAGQRHGARDFSHGLEEQLEAERAALRRVGEIAVELGVTIAVENSYPEPPILDGRRYAYAARPSILAEQVAAVDHPAVGICLDVGHAAVAATAFGFDYLEDCAVAAPLVRHVHLHDNFGRPDPEGESRIGERLAYGLGDLHLPPGRGTIPLEELLGRPEFADEITCCVELSPNLPHLAAEALEATRRPGEAARPASSIL